MRRLTIDEMDLQPNTRRAAEIIQAEYPNVWFTSGRRTMEDQARAMAQNAVLVGPTWIIDTYSARRPRLVKALMTHLAENPHRANDVVALTEDFYTILKEDFTPEFMTFPHFQGRAIDCRWPRLKNGEIDFEEGKKLCYIIRNLKKIHRIPLQLLLEKEGGLYVIHSQYEETPVAASVPV